MITTDLCDDTTAVEKEKVLTEHFKARTGHTVTRPLCIIGVAAFCDRSLFSQPQDSDGLVSIEVHGYVQVKNATPLSTIKRWIDSPALVLQNLYTDVLGIKSDMKQVKQVTPVVSDLSQVVSQVKGRALSSLSNLVY